MQITRKITMETTDVQVGDQIQVGKYTATCQKLPAPGLGLFFLDQYLDKPEPWNETDTTAGGYSESHVRRAINSPETLAIFEGLPLVPDPGTGDLLRLPLYGEIFGHDETYHQWNVEEDTAEQWPLMADRRNRLAVREGDNYEWGWLQNRRSASNACHVNDDGAAASWSASVVVGVRPAFLLKLS